MVITGQPMREGLTIVSVMNRGRRPVTINSVGAWRTYPHNPIGIPETHPDLPHELTEGQNLIAVIPRCDLDLKSIICWEACDAVGRTYKLNVAPWHTRLFSGVRWHFHLSRKFRAAKY